MLIWSAKYVVKAYGEENPEYRMKGQAQHVTDAAAHGRLVWKKLRKKLRKRNPLQENPRIRGIIWIHEDVCISPFLTVSRLWQVDCGKMPLIGSCCQGMEVPDGAVEGEVEAVRSSACMVV